MNPVIPKNLPVNDDVDCALSTLNDAVIDSVLKTLNEAFAADPAAIHAILSNRVLCKMALADHPTIQVDQVAVLQEPKPYAVGFLGLLNGVLEPVTGRRVASRWSDENGAHTLKGFCEYKPAKLE